MSDRPFDRVPDQSAIAQIQAAFEDDEPVDQHGNPLSGDRIINCPFPECGCDGSRLCMAENGPSRAACWVNIERGSKL